MQINKTLTKPLLTEKSVAQKGEFNRYHFKVNTSASKNAIAEHIQRLYGVTVTGVRTMVVSGKKRRVGKTRRFVKTQKWKKAIVTLASGQEIKSDA